MLQCHNRYRGPMNGARRARQWVLRVVTVPPGRVRTPLPQRGQRPHRRRRGLGRLENSGAGWVANARLGPGNIACWHRQRDHEGGGGEPWRWPGRLRSGRRGAEMNAGTLSQPKGGQRTQSHRVIWVQLALCREHTHARGHRVHRKSRATSGGSRARIGRRRDRPSGNEGASACATSK